MPEVIMNHSVPPFDMYRFKSFAKDKFKALAKLSSPLHLLQTVVTPVSESHGNFSFVSTLPHPQE